MGIVHFRICIFFFYVSLQLLFEYLAVLAHSHQALRETWFIQNCVLWLGSWILPQNCSSQIVFVSFQEQRR